MTSLSPEQPCTLGPLFASLKICSLYRHFYSKEVIARKTEIQLDNDNIGNDRDY